MLTGVASGLFHSFVLMRDIQLVLLLVGNLSRLALAESAACALVLHIREGARLTFHDSATLSSRPPTIFAAEWHPSAHRLVSLYLVAPSFLNPATVLLRSTSIRIKKTQAGTKRRYCCYNL